MRVEAGDVGYGLIFSGIAEIRCGDELRRDVGIQSRGGDVWGIEDGDGGIISAWECVADGQLGGITESSDGSVEEAWDQRSEFGPTVRAIRREWFGSAMKLG